MRKKYSMDREWKFHLVDIAVPAARIHEEAYARSKAGGAAGAGGINHDDVSWPVVNLPHDWSVYSEFDKDASLAQGYKERGIAWYRKTFTIPEEHKDKHLLLVFDGIATECEVFFNGSVLKRNYSGYNEFTVDITDRAYFGDRPNVLSIRVNADVFEGWWYEGAGIYRHVWLYVKEMLHISHNGLWINPVKKQDGTWTVELETTVENSGYQPLSFDVETQILLDGKMVSSKRSHAQAPEISCSVVKQEIDVDQPELWDLDSPRLYELQCRILADGVKMDETCEHFGFRTIAFTPDKGFFLNGKNRKLKGVCCHPDHAGVGTAVPDSIQEYRIAKLKEIGCNAYRCSHGNPTRELLDACDRLGMLVMDENRHFESSEEVLEQVRSMVRRDRNHPCVIMYSLYNEEPLQATPEGRKIYARMQLELKRLDKTRPALGAMNGGATEDSGSANLMDVTGINYNTGAYDTFHQRFPNNCVIGSENVSAVSTRGCYRTDDSAHQMASYDEEVMPWGLSVRESWRAVNERDFVAGLFVWTGFDYRGEPSPYRWPSVSSQFGLLDTCGFPKEAAYFQKACWAEEPMVHILPHWNWNEGETVRVMTVTNGDEVELFLNGRSLGRRPSTVYEQNEWQVPFEKGCISAQAYRNGVCVAKTEQRTAGPAKRLLAFPNRDWIYNDGVDALALNICAVDENGIPVPTADGLVKVACSAGGKVLGMGNGDPNCHEPDYLPQRSLFAGWCQAIVALEDGTESLSVTVTSAGLEPASLSFEVRSAATTMEYLYSVKDIPVGNWRMSGSNLPERPDPTQVMADYDMNTLEPVSFGEEYQNSFTEGYRLYMTKLLVPSDKEYQLVFKGLSGNEVEVYIDGKLLHRGGYGGGQNGLTLPLQGIAGEVPLTLCIRASTWIEKSGIRGTVCLRGE